MNKKNKKLMNNTIIFFIGNIGSKFIQFILVPLYTYTLTTAEYGVTELVITASNFLMPIFSMQVSDAFLRFGLDKNYKKNEVYKIVLKILNIGTLLSIVCIPLFCLNETLKNWIYYFIIILNLRIYRDIFSISLKIDDKNKLYTIDSILYTLVLCISNIILLAVCHLGITGYFISYIIANLFSIIFLVIISNFDIKILKVETNKKLQKEIIIYSIPMIINSISYWITNASDKYMIQWLMTDSDVGIYSVAAKIPTFLTTFTGIFAQAWVISAISEYNEDENNGKYYSETFKNFCSAAFIGCCLLILIIKPFMRIYVSSEFFIAWKYSPVLIISAVFSGIAAFLIGIFYAMKKTISVTITTLCGGMLNIVLNYFLIKKIGIMGASVATLLSWILVVALRLGFIKKLINFNYDIFKVIFDFFIVVIEAICVLKISDNIVYVINIMLCVVILVNEREFILKVLNQRRIKNEKYKEKI